MLIRLTAIVAAMLGLTQSTHAVPPTTTPLEVVKLRMQYYNDHNVDAMLALYSEDIDETISRDLAVTPLTQTVNYDDFVELTARAREIFDPLSKHGWEQNGLEE